jgi:phosphorylcholine metabolism protein LicD
LARRLQSFCRDVLHSFRLKWLYKRTRPERKIHAFLCRLPFRWSLLIDRCLYSAIRLLGSPSSDEIFVLDICKRRFFKKSYFENTKLYPFEEGRFWGIGDYDSYLSDFYGADYMTPKKWGHVADYSQVIV